jgi:hypothetical protein
MKILANVMKYLAGTGLGNLPFVASDSSSPFLDLLCDQIG